MSFGPNQATKNANNAQQGLVNDQRNAANTEFGQGTGLLNLGGQNVASGTNFFNTLLNGNQANTTSLLAPNIRQIQDATQNSLQTANTLLPRGGGRFATNYAASFAPESQITGLFNTMRAPAAEQLTQTGLAQQGIGTNLFSLGNQGLAGAGGTNAALLKALMDQSQQSNGIFGMLGQGLGAGLSLIPGL